MMVNSLGVVYIEVHLEKKGKMKKKKKIKEKIGHLECVGFWCVTLVGHVMIAYPHIPCCCHC